MFRNTTLNLAVFIIILIFFCCTYYSAMVFMYPTGIHAWAQADRLALAIKYFDNGMNFFKPATYDLSSDGGVTGVEFPIQAYIAAALGHIFGRSNISLCFRSLDIFTACLGLSFMFLTVYRLTKDFVFSILPPLFMFCAPVFIIYTCNYLPDTASLSLSFIAFYYLLLYLDKNNFKHLVIAVGFLTIGTLIKSTLCIYLSGVIAYALYEIIFRTNNELRKKRFSLLITMAAVASVVAGYYLYNQYLNKHYHSKLFLAQTYPFQNGDEFQGYVNNFKFLWMREYFVLPQYVILFTLISAALFLPKESALKKGFYLCGIFLIGALCMAFLFGHQLLMHDYYILVIFFPLVAFALLLSVITIYKNITAHSALRAFRAAMLTAIFLCFFFADYHVYRRIHRDPFQYAGWGWSESEEDWLHGGAALLDKTGVDKREKILVLSDGVPNLALVYFDRNGYVMNTADSAYSVPNVVRFARNNHIRFIIGRKGLFDDLKYSDTSTPQYFIPLYKDKVELLGVRP